jgi:hypothetical protein
MSNQRKGQKVRNLHRPATFASASPWWRSPVAVVRLELQNLHAELAATLTVVGILDVLRVRVHGCVSGEISGPALGVQAGPR